MNMFSFWPYHGVWGILVLQPGTEPEPPAWKHGVLPLGQQASHCTHIFNVSENSLDCNCDTPWNFGGFNHKNIDIHCHINAQDWKNFH